MSTITIGPEVVAEYEAEAEHEWHGELESEEFFRRLAGLARRATQSPRLRRVARAAARSVGGSLGDVGAALGGRPGTRGASVGGAAGAAVGRVLADLFPQSGDPELELELEWEGEANPIRRIYPDALMEHLAHRATETESEAEAEALVGALVPLAARLVPRVAPVIMRAAPQLARGVAQATRVLRADPTTRPLVRAVPQIVRHTAASIARQSAAGRQVTPTNAVATLARQTARTLSDPQRCTAAYRRSRALDRAYHRQVRAIDTRATPSAAGDWAPACPSCGR